MIIPSAYKKIVPAYPYTSRKGDIMPFGYPIGLTAILFFLSQLLIKMTIHLHKHKGSPPRTTKPIALGGMMKAAMVSTEKVVEAIELVKKQIEVTIFTKGLFNLEQLNKTNLQDGRNDQ